MNTKQQHKKVIRKPRTWNENLDLFRSGWDRTSRLSFIAIEIATLVSLLFKGLGGLFRVVGIILCFVSAVALPISGLAWCLKARSVAQTTFRISKIVLVNGVMLAVIGAVFWGLNKAKRLLVKRIVPITQYQLGTLLHHTLERDKRPFSKFFSNHFLVSNNFLQIAHDDPLLPQQKPFTDEQKPLFELLVIQDEDRSGNKRIKVMAIDQNDALFFKRKLKADQKSKKAVVSQRRRKIAIVDIPSGIILAQGKNVFKVGELEGNIQYKNLFTEAKFLSGEVHYSPEELNYIASKKEKVGASLLHSFFYNAILMPSKKKRAAAQELPIGKLLKSI